MSDTSRRRPPAPRRGEDELDGIVRPYALTGGRTRTAVPLPVEALVQALVAPAVSDTAERRRILELCADRFESVAEIGAHLGLPVGVVRVVVSDLMASGQVRVHGLTSATTTSPSIALDVLESVLDGITSL